MIELKHSTILIHAMNDHQDRVDNLRIVLKWLRRNFNTRIILTENIHGEFDYRWAHCFVDLVITVKEQISHSTRYVNMMAKAAGSPVVIHWLHDVILELPESVAEAEREIVSHETDFIYPYENAYLIDRKFHVELERSLDQTKLEIPNFKNRKLNHGYIIAASREKFLESGGLNENMLEYGPIDKESNLRWSRLGYRMSRKSGAVLHLDHWRPSGVGRFYDRNGAEYHKVASLSALGLQEYVRTRLN